MSMELTVKPMKAKVAAVLKKPDGRCAYCGFVLLVGEITVDHIVPRYAGGGGSLDNLFACCRACNSKKAKRGIDDFRLWLTYEDIARQYRFSAVQLQFMASALELERLLPREKHVFFYEMLSGVGDV